MRTRPDPRQQRRTRRIALLIIGGGLAFLLGAGWWMWSNTVGYVPPPRPTFTQRQVSQAKTRIEAVRQQVVQAGQAQRAEPFRLEFSEDEINAYLASREGELGELREVRVHIAPGNLVSVSGWATAEGREMWVTAIGTVSAAGPDLSVEIRDVKVGNMSLPASVREKYLAQYRRQLFRIPTDLPVSSMRIETREGAVVVSGVTR